MLFSWQIFTVISVICYSLLVLLQRVTLRTPVRPIAYAIFSQLFCAVIFLILGLINGQLKAFNFSMVWWNVILMTVLYAIGNIWVAHALKITEASKFTVLFAGRGLVTIAVTTLVLQEHMTWVQLAGAGLIFLGVVLASWEAKKLTLQKGDYLTLAAAVCFGIANANDRALLQSIPVFTYLVLAYGLPALLISMWKPAELAYAKEFFRQPLFNKIALLTFFAVVSGVTFYLALSTSPQAGPVIMGSLTSVILIVGLSVIFLKERSHLWQKLIGAILGFVGLVLLG